MRVGVVNNLYITSTKNLRVISQEQLHCTRPRTFIRRANGLTAYIHQVATLFLTKLGETDLAWIAASRGLTAANASEDHVVIGSLSRAAAHALTSNGEYCQAREVGAAAAEYLQPLLSTPTPQLLSVYGSLHLMCALSAARDDDRQTARNHLAEAGDSAKRLGSGGNYMWTAFGPTNVTIHQVCVAWSSGTSNAPSRSAPAWTPVRSQSNAVYGIPSR